MTSLKWGRGGGGGGGLNLTYRLAALGLDYSFGDECMFLKRIMINNVYTSILYGICMMMVGGV